mmetsp:Transcript_21756/g.32379  ORF Transcript_21756/g.32379 Transcript_21756/m.32379 type:complete len:223 (+) Transcript_21756:78-746(+)
MGETTSAQPERKGKIMEVWGEKWCKEARKVLGEFSITRELIACIIEFSTPTWGHTRSKFKDHFKLNCAIAVKKKWSESSIYYNKPLLGGVWEITVSLAALGEPSWDSSDSDTDMWTHIGFSGTTDNRVIGWGKQTYSLFQNGGFYSERTIIGGHGGLKFTRGDKITARIDFYTGSIYFYVNGRFNREVIHKPEAIQAPMWFGITMQEPGQKAKILQIQHSIK